MTVIIRLAKRTDIISYTNFLQETYEATYTNDTIGLSSACFSKEIFNSKDTQKYLLSNLVMRAKQKTWLAFSTTTLVGSITMIHTQKTCELRGFYVLPHYQGQGIGKKLWKKALPFAKGKDITLDTYAHNTKTIELYTKWGFIIDRTRGEFYRHWQEWPENVQAKCVYMRLKNAQK